MEMDRKEITRGEGGNEEMDLKTDANRDMFACTRSLLYHTHTHTRAEAPLTS